MKGQVQPHFKQIHKVSNDLAPLYDVALEKKDFPLIFLIILNSLQLLVT